MVFKVVGYAQAQASGAMIVVENKHKYVVIRNIIGCIMCVVLNCLLIPIYGVIGAAISSVLTAICTGYLSHLIIPQYKVILVMQTRAFLVGWKDLMNFSHYKSF